MLNTFEVALVDELGLDTPDTVIASIEDAFDTVPTADGYTFNGWYTAAVGGTLVSASTVNSTAIDRTLYAHWTINVSTVTFDSDGGTAVLPKTWTYGELFVLPTNPTYTGYTFDGWFDENGIEITSNTVNPDGENLTLTAQWVPVEYTITYDANGGLLVGGQDSVTEEAWTYGSVFSLAAGPTRDGYTFDGWYTASGDEGVKVTTYSTASSTTLYAHWIAAP